MSKKEIIINLITNHLKKCFPLESHTATQTSVLLENRAKELKKNLAGSYMFDCAQSVFVVEERIGL